MMKEIGKRLNNMGFAVTIDSFEDTSIGQRFNAKMGPDFETGPCYLISKKQKNILSDFNVFETAIIKDGYFINKPEWFTDELIEVVKPLLNNE